MGWVTGGTGSVSHQVGQANHPGIDRVTSGATNPSVLSIFTGNNSGTSPIAGSEMFDITWIISPVSLNAATCIRAGLATGAPSSDPPGNGAWIERDDADTDWFGVGKVGGVATRTSGLLGGVVTAGAWYKLRVRRVDATTLGFSVNDGVEQTLAVGQPTALAPVLQVATTEAVAKSVDVDLVILRVTGLTR